MSELIKNLLFENDAREKLIKGISTPTRAVASTMGPCGKTVIIESPEHTKSITVTKDGYNVLRSIQLLDPVENMACTALKEAAFKTAMDVGDGTTAATVLAEALILLGNEKIKSGMNQTQVLRYLEEISKDVIAQLVESAIPSTDEILLQVATISANNDERLGKVIVDTYKEVGDNGVVSFSLSPNKNTYSEVTEGLRINQGYTNPLFINHREKDQCIMTDVNILVSTLEIRNFEQLANILEVIVPSRQKLLIIAPCDGNVVNTLAANVNQGKLQVCVIPAPAMGYRQFELMEDIALATGSTFFSEKTGDDLSHLNFNNLGFAPKIIVSKDKTEIFGRAGNAEELATRVEQLKKSQELTDNKYDKEFIDQRIASLAGSIGTINVGGNTDLEQKELFDRVEDSVKAVKATKEEGIVSGSGLALFEVKITKIGDKEYEIAKEIMLEAIKKPLKQILKNADMVFDEHYHDDDEIGYGCNLKTGEWGNLISLGVIDPLKVVRTALENAVSVAITILSTNTSISITRA